MRSNKILSLIFGVACLLALALLTGCSSDNNHSSYSPTPSNLATLRLYYNNGTSGHYIPDCVTQAVFIGFDASGEPIYEKDLTSGLGGIIALNDVDPAVTTMVSLFGYDSEEDEDTLVIDGADAQNVQLQANKTTEIKNPRYLKPAQFNQLIQSLEVTPNPCDLNVGQSVELKAYATFIMGNDTTSVLNVSNECVYSCDSLCCTIEDNKITGVQEGQADLDIGLWTEARTQEDFITVTDESSTLSEITLEDNAGKTESTEVTWNTDDTFEMVAKPVSADGTDIASKCTYTWTTSDEDGNYIRRDSDPEATTTFKMTGTDMPTDPITITVTAHYDNGLKVDKDAKIEVTFK